MQLVPDAMTVTLLHIPLAQRWKLLPPMQFHKPSEVHAPVRPAPLPVVPVVRLPVLDEVALGKPESELEAPATTVAVAAAGAAVGASGVYPAAGAEPAAGLFVVAVSAAEPDSMLLGAAETTMVEVRVNIEVAEMVVLGTAAVVMGSATAGVGVFSGLVAVPMGVMA